MRPPTERDLFDRFERAVEDAQVVLAERRDVELAARRSDGVREVTGVHIALHMAVLGVEERELALDVVFIIVLGREVEDGEVCGVNRREARGEARDLVLARDLELAVDAQDLLVVAAAHVQVAVRADLRARKERAGHARRRLRPYCLDDLPRRRVND